MGWINSLAGAVGAAVDWAADNPELVVAGLGLVASYFLNNGAKDAQEAQALAELALVEASNEERLRLERWNRGALEEGGNAVLPLYFGEDDPDTDEVESFEANLAQDVVDTYLGHRDQTGDALAFGDQVWYEMQPSYEMGNQFIEDVFTGDLLADRQALVDRTYGDLFAGVDRKIGRAGRTLDDYEGRSGEILSEHEALNEDASTARRAAINSGLGDRLRQIQLERMRLGHGGQSSLSNNLAAGAVIGARQAAAMGDIDDSRNLLSERQRVNEMFLPQRMSLHRDDRNAYMDIGKAYTSDTMFGFDKDQDTKRGMLDAPMARAMQAYDFGFLPFDQDYRAFDEAADRLNFFRVQGGTPQVETPNSYFVPTTGMVLGASASGALDSWSRWNQSNDDDKDDDYYDPNKGTL